MVCLVGTERPPEPFGTQAGFVIGLDDQWPRTVSLRLRLPLPKESQGGHTGRMISYDYSRTIIFPSHVTCKGNIRAPKRPNLRGDFVYTVVSPLVISRLAVDECLPIMG